MYNQLQETISESKNEKEIDKISQKINEIKQIYSNINNNIYDYKYLYDNRCNNTINHIIDIILEKSLLNLFYAKNNINIINDLFGVKFELFDNKFINQIKKICDDLNLNNTICKLLVILFAFSNTIEVNDQVLAKMLNISKQQLVKYLFKLKQLGLLSNNINKRNTVTLAVYTFMDVQNKSFAEHLLNTYQDNNIIKLSLQDYPELLQTKIQNIITLLKNHDGKKPCNILLYGKSGSGKSSLIDYLQREIKNKIFCPITNKTTHIYNINHLTMSEVINNDVDINQTVDDKSNLDANSASDRLQQLRLCASLPVKNKYIFIMDEADDSINNPQSDYDCWLTGKKQLNELLEDVKTPVIWIANHIDKLDESTCRRFSFSIKFDELNFKQRAEVWKNQIKYTHVEQLVKDIDIEQLAIKYKISAGLINSILESLKLLNPSPNKVLESIENFARSHCDLIGVNCNYSDNRQAEHTNYSIDGLNIKSNISLNDIKDGLLLFYKQLQNKSNINKNCNVLLDGYPGTGKTEYAKYIARYLDAPLITCHGSDFLSKWVGETEQNIKNIFQEAEQTKSILFIDEADGLIHQREGAKNSWEVTQINEFLCNMEKFNGILICATNFLNNMDKASIRRFSFKITFDYLSEEGKLIFFNRFFSTFNNFNEDQIKKQLININKLVPGDFKVVRDRCNFLKGGIVDQQFIINELKQEVQYKNSQKQTIGFVNTII